MSVKNVDTKESLEDILRDIIQIEGQSGSLGVSFTKSSDYLQGDHPALCMTPELAILVRDIMPKSAEIISDDNIAELPPVYEMR